MDELQQAWQKLQEKQFADKVIAKNTILESIYQESHSPLNALKKRTKYKLYWMIFFTVLNTVGMILTRNTPDFTVILAVFEVYFLATLLYTIYQVKKIIGLSFTEDLKYVVTEYHHRVKSVLRFEESIGLLFMPIAVMGGGFIGAMLKKGESLNQVMQSPKLLIALIITLIIYTPIGYFVAKWANKKLYGKYLKQLEDYIRQMESAD